MPYSQHSRVTRATTPSRRWLLAGAGLVVVHLGSLLAGEEDGLWLPGLGLGLALVAWLGLAIVPLLALDLLLARVLLHADQTLPQDLGDSVLLAAEMGLSWWVYAHLARGSRRLEDPRSATVFLILVPGALAASMASIQALLWGWAARPQEAFLPLASGLWISRALQGF